MTTLRPIGERIVVQALEKEDTTSFGLVLPPDAQELPQRGTVIAVGSGKWSSDGSYQHDPDVAVGDTVLYAKYAGHEVKVDGEQYLIINIEQVLGVLQNLD